MFPQKERCLANPVLSTFASVQLLLVSQVGVQFSDECRNGTDQLEPVISGHHTGWMIVDLVNGAILQFCQTLLVGCGGGALDRRSQL
jgi:hypothetical protein